MFSPEKEKLSEFNSLHDYQADLNAVLERSLTPESIDIYAEQALIDTIRLVEQSVEDFSYQPTIRFKNKLETETNAFSYFKLGDVEQILDHIANKVEEMRDIDVFISETPTLDTVILPPDNIETSIYRDGSGGSEVKTIPRLKTVLFLLENQFDVDIHDPEQLDIVQGKITPGMFRKNSYFALELPSLQKTVLVCDQVGNATFVFDKAALDGYGISREDLLKLTKSDINQFLKDNQSLGKAIRYRKDFYVNNIISELSSTEDEEIDTNFLYLPATKEQKSIAGIANDLNLSHYVVAKAVKSLDDDLGDIEKRRFGSHVANAFDKIQQVIIRQHLETNGHLTVQPPEGILSAKGIMHRFGLNDNETVTRAIDKIGSELGETFFYKFGGMTVKGYDEAQQDLIHEYLETNGIFSETAPEGILSLIPMAEKIGCSPQKAKKISIIIKDTLGKINLYRFGTRATLGYTPLQQTTIKAYLDEDRLNK